MVHLFLELNSVNTILKHRILRSSSLCSLPIPLHLLLSLYPFFRVQYCQLFFQMACYLLMNLPDRGLNYFKVRNWQLLWHVQILTLRGDNRLKLAQIVIEVYFLAQLLFFWGWRHHVRRFIIWLKWGVRWYLTTRRLLNILGNDLTFCTIKNRHLFLLLIAVNLIWAFGVWPWLLDYWLEIHWVDWVLNKRELCFLRLHYS